MSMNGTAMVRIGPGIQRAYEISLFPVLWIAPKCLYFGFLARFKMFQVMFQLMMLRMLELKYKFHFPENIWAL